MDIIISHLSKNFGEKAVLQDVNFTIPAGKITCLMGPSGRGKTTLLRCIAGLEQPQGGTISGVPMRIGFLFQEDRLCDAFSALCNIRLVAAKSVSDSEIFSHLVELGLADAAMKPTRDLSGGMRRRVALARAVLYGGDLLLLDEPFKGLDATLRQKVMDYLKKYSAGKTVLLVTHDPSEAAYLDAVVMEL